MSDATIEEYELVRRVGLDGTFYVTREVWPIMVQRRYGRIVVTTSGDGLLGNPASVSYSIAKAGVYGRGVIVLEPRNRNA
jgi:NAD(P)-dependent dehydrogenase (short-subunit alcohol dehydrogenase family)